MTLVDYTVLHERQWELWADFDPWTNPDFPFAIYDGNRADEPVTRAATVSVLMAWLDIFSRDASVTLDRWSIVEACRKAKVAERQEFSVRVPRLYLVADGREAPKEDYPQLAEQGRKYKR